MSQMSLEDPGSAFLASGDPARFLEDNLPATDARPEEDEDHKEVAIALAGAFLAWRLFMVYKLRQEPPPVEPARAVRSILWKFTPFWMRVVGPSVLDAYRRFAPQLSQEEREAIASDYVARLGQYVHETSAEALVGGYQAQLARGTNPTLAWMRAVEAFGLDSKRMRSWLAAQGVDQTGWSGVVPPSAKRALDKALFMRADLLGQTEAWQLRMVAKNIVWLADLRDGTLPQGARKRWVTADDEMVCPVCRPLHMNEVLVDEQFRLPTGQEVWAPGVHPNCRCELELVYPEVFVEKAAPGDPYDRDAEGRFARQESRTRRVPRREAPVREQEVDPEVARLFREMTITPVEEVEEGAPSIFGTGAAPLIQRGAPSITGRAPSLMGTAPSIFGEAPSIFGEAPLLFATPQERQLIILAQQQQQEGEKNVFQDDRQLWIATDWFWPSMFTEPPRFMSEDATAPSRTFPRLSQPDVDAEAVVDFDLWALRNQRKRGLSEPRPFDRVHVTQGGLPRQLFSTLAAEYDEAARVTQLERDSGDKYLNMRKPFEDRAIDNVEIAATQLSASELQKIFREAGQYETVRRLGGNRHAMMHQLIASVQNYGSPDSTGADASVAHAYVTHMADHYPPEAMEEIMAEVEEDIGDLRANFLRVPQIFTFKDGRWQGYWSAPGETGMPVVQGRYKVVAIKKHSMLQDFGTPGMVPRSEDFDPRFSGSARFPSWEEVVLELIPD